PRPPPRPRRRRAALRDGPRRSRRARGAGAMAIRAGANLSRWLCAGGGPLPAGGAVVDGLRALSTKQIFDSDDSAHDARELLLNVCQLEIGENLLVPIIRQPAVEAHDPFVDAVEAQYEIS